LKYIELKVI